MQNKLDVVRQSITAWFRKQFPEDHGLSFSESFLIKDDHYAGHKFYQHENEIQAIWLLDRNTIEIRRAGRIADTLILGDGGQGHQAATKAA